MDEDCVLYLSFVQGNNWDRKGVHINQLVMGSEATCCGSGLSGIWLLIIHFIC